jgi:ribosomal protein S6--L-glutamate ligase
MRIAILSRSPRCYSTRRLVQEARSAGHHVEVVDTLKLTIGIEDGSAQLFYKNKPVSPWDAVIPRVGTSVTRIGTAVVRQLEQMGVRCLNSSEAIHTSRDKLRALQCLNAVGVPLPPTTLVSDKDDLPHALARVGGAPVVLKLLEGSQGVGVILADSLKAAESIVQTFQSTRQNLLIQKFVKESRGRDIRVLVIDGEVVGAMRRTAQGDEFRSNLHRGGVSDPVELPEEFAAVAIRAAEAVGLRVAGVDLLESHQGPLVLEINSSPGLQGLERTTGGNIAGRMISALHHAHGPAQHTGAMLPRLVGVMRTLLGPAGCPWDREQTLQSLRAYMLEEAYEAVDAIDREAYSELSEELGDVLLQVVFQSELCRQQGRFGIHDVISSICEKLIRRHPHVFGDVRVQSSREVISNWEAIKEQERIDRKKATGAFAGVPVSMPALVQAVRLGEKASAVGYDWSDFRGAREKIHEELGELDELLTDAARIERHRAAVEHEVGDVLQAVANLSRKLDIDPESALRASLNRFRQRFEHLEQYCKTNSVDLRAASPSERDHLWELAKRALSAETAAS